MIQDDILKVPIEEAPFCIIDVETTGLSAARNGIIEIAMVKVSGSKIVDKYHSLINPGKEIPYYITQLTGISTDDVFESPFFEDIVDEISDFISEEILVGHNFSFDLSFLRKEFRYCGRDSLINLNLCTLKIARRLYPFLRSKSLGTVVNHLNLKNISSHRAEGDAEVTARAFIKMVKELKENHSIITVSDLINFQSVPKSSQYRHSKIKRKLGEDVSALPDAPGIYYFLNSRDEIIYIGKAKSLKNRVKSYFSSVSPRKAKKIVQQASRLKTEITNSELTALLAEAESIKILRPKHNTLLKKYGNKYFLRINISHPFPLPEICNYFDFDGNDYFGLFISRKKALAVLDMVNRTFSLRECSDEEFAKERKCFLAEIERCTAPCVNKEKIVYNEELEKVYEFLYGKSQFALNRLLNKMKGYSDQQKYEKAAEVKELVDMILSQTHKSSLLAEPVNLANVLFEINEGINRDYILMLAGKIFIKKYALKEKDYFEEALDDYFEKTIYRNVLPGEEDLEKIKITLNWLIKNRNKVRTFYLKDYQSKQELYSQLTSYNISSEVPAESYFDIKFLINNYRQEPMSVEKDIS
ncbi:MAG: exonuclease domain-containing protein [Ignavibacteriaceae bacterium]